MTLAIFLLHRVAPLASEDRWGLTVEPSEFKALIERLVDSGTLVSIQEGLAYVSQGGQAPVTAVTFDDGYEDLLTYAFPVLDALDAPSTIFLATRYVNDGAPFWWEVLRWLEHKPALLARHASAWNLPTGRSPAATVDAWCAHWKRFTPARRDELQSQLDCPTWLPRALSPCELTQRPDGCQLGCHGHTHTVLSVLKPTEIASELKRSHYYLNKWSRSALPIFAFPNGQREDFNEEHRSQLVDAGLIAALTTLHGTNRPGADPYMLRRISVQPGKAIAQAEAVLAPSGILE